MLSLFASANAEVVQNRRDVADRILAKLNNHLDYAENFILDLYYNYGTEMAYFALKNAGFTIQEHDTADAIWIGYSSFEAKVERRGNCRTKETTRENESQLSQRAKYL